METLKTYINTNGISRVLIYAKKIKTAFHYFQGNSIWHMYEKLTKTDLSNHFH